MFYRLIALCCAASWLALGSPQAYAGGHCASKCAPSCVVSKTKKRCIKRCHRRCRHKRKRCRNRCEMGHLKNLRACVKQRPGQRAQCLGLANAKRKACQAKCSPGKTHSHQAAGPCLGRCRAVLRAKKKRCRSYRGKTKRRCLQLSYSHYRHCKSRCGAHGGH